MSPRRSPIAGLLRWYPAAWRERYGEELAGLIEDDLDGRPITLRFRLSMVRAGLRERGHQSGLTGHAAPPPDRVRAGFLLVLAAWTAFVAAGTVFAKLSEHFAHAVPGGAHAISVTAFGVVQVLATICALLVLAGALTAGAALRRFLRAGGWRSVCRPVLRAAGATVVAAAALTWLTLDASTLTSAARNGGDRLYSAGFVLVALLLGTALTLWTVAAVAIARRLTLSRRVLAMEAAAASAVTAGMILMTAATASWWGAVASSAPWFLHGTARAPMVSAFTPNLIGVMTVMLVAGVIATYGVTRVARSWREVRPAGPDTAHEARS
jgi:hypothetical protein